MCSNFVFKELELQAHGLAATSPSLLNHTDSIKQESDPMQGVEQQLPVPQQTPYQHVGDLSAAAGYQNSACAQTSFPAISRSEIDLMLLEDTVLSSDPMMRCDPIMSTLSPGTSKASSRRSSFSIDGVDCL